MDFQKIIRNFDRIYKETDESTLQFLDVLKPRDLHRTLMYFDDVYGILNEKRYPNSLEFIHNISSLLQREKYMTIYDVNYGKQCEIAKEVWWEFKLFNTKSLSITSHIPTNLSIRTYPTRSVFFI